MDEGFKVTRLQGNAIGHTENHPSIHDADCTFLQGLQVVTLCLSKTMMPHNTSIFKDRPNNSGVKAPKVNSREASSLQLF